MSRSLDEKFLVLKGGAEYNSLNGYNTRQQALADGALIWAYGYAKRTSVDIYMS